MPASPHPAWLQAMQQPAFYDHPTRDIRLVQTHASWVVLTGDYAYKIKKPVDFGFLDFSTLERRRRMCHRELAMNRRLAPDIYLGVLAIHPANEGFRLAPDEAGAVEYCLQMRQFDAEALLAREMDEGRFHPAWMDDLGRQVADFHAEAEIVRRPPFGDGALLGHYIEDNLAAAARLARLPGMPDHHTPLARAATRMLAALATRIEARRQGGHVRACHGDLHLGNIALVAGRPCIFDCIEFNDELSLIDTMNDAAFLIMDCDARGHPELGRRFLSRYLEHTGDYEALALLRLYQLYRASVRGKVALLLSEDAALAVEAVAAKRREAAAYFELAAAYAAPPPAPRLFAIGGLSGSGKSRLAMLGSAAEGALVIRSDATRRRLAKGAEARYSPAMTEATYAAMRKAADTALAAGFPVILDATFLDPAERHRARGLAAAHGIDLDMVWLDIPAPELRRRVAARHDAGTDVSEADLAVLESQIARYQRPEEAGIRFLQNSDAWP